LSLNPKKSHFAMQKGKLFDHIVSKDGIKVDPKRVEAIDLINIPRNRKEIQSFFGKTKIFRRFIPNFVEIIKLITDMIKKDNEVKWTTEFKASFECVKKSIGEAPILVSPDYTKEFLIFSFASKLIVAVVLLQKNEEGFEQPIAFFSKSLRDTELRYDILEKQAYALVKDLKSFRTYVFHSKVISYLPTNAIKVILVQSDSDGRRGRWLDKIQEFYLEVKPTKIMKGQALTRLLTKSNFKALGINNFESHDYLLDIEEIDDQAPIIHIEDKFSSSAWYRDIVTYLLTLQCPNDMTPSKARTLKLHAIKYCTVDGKLYWKDLMGFLLCCPT
jgi:hypothetical protein